MGSQALLAPSNGWPTLVSLLNCTHASSQIACVRAVDAVTISTLATQNLLFFLPTVDHVTHVDHIGQSIFSRTAAHVPLLLGTNVNELGEAAALSQVSNIYSATIAGFLPNTTSAKETFNGPLARETTIMSDATAALVHVLNQYPFTCGSSALASFAAQNEYPVWRDLYNGTFASASPYPGAETNGATHSSELPIVFGTYATNTTDQQRLSILSAYV